MGNSSTGRRGSVHIAASLGGHLEVLTAARGAFDGLDRVWVTSEGSKAQALRAEGERVEVLPRMDRRNLAPDAFRRGAVLARALHPEVVVTSGAGVVAPFCLASRALGARIVFVETMARVTTPSVTGRVLRRVAGTVLVQWPELRAVYPSAIVCRPLLLEGDARTAGDRAGTFVSLGSHDAAFGRLVRMVVAAAGQGILPEPVVVQAGVTPVPDAGLDVRPFLEPGEFASLVARSAVVISHGGAGAMATAIRSGVRPLVLSRSAAHGEHVDDHQGELVGKLADLGLVRRIDDGIDQDALAAVLDAPAPARVGDGLPGLVETLGGALAR